MITKEEIAMLRAVELKPSKVRTMHYDTIKRLIDALEIATEGLEFYASGKVDLEPKPEKSHLYAKDFLINTPEWRQRSMSDYICGGVARTALKEIYG